MKWRSPRSVQHEIDLLHQAALANGLRVRHSLMTDSWHLIDQRGEAVGNPLRGDGNTFTALDAIQFLRRKPR